MSLSIPIDIYDNQLPDCSPLTLTGNMEGDKSDASEITGELIIAQNK